MCCPGILGINDDAMKFSRSVFGYFMLLADLMKEFPDDDISRHSYDRIGGAGHAEIGDVGSALGGNLGIGCLYVCMRAKHEGRTTGDIFT